MKRTAILSRGKPMKRKASKPRTRKSATGPLVDLAHLDGVRGLCCCACGAPAPSDPHHCKDRPPFVELGVYRFFPEFAMKSADFDAIPLCRPCHDLFHRNHGEFSLRYGPDYSYLPTTRATLEPMEISF